MSEEIRASEKSYFEKAADLVKTVGAAIKADGMLAAAFRQGASELGEALKAFPDAIQVDEPGTLLSPTQGEIAKARNPPGMSPSDIARDNTPYVPEHGSGHDIGKDQGRDMGLGM